MDSFLPQMDTFDFDRLDPIALEQTLAYLKAHPEPEDFQAMMDDAVAEKDWLDGDGMQDIGMEMGIGGQSSSPEFNLTRLAAQTLPGPSSTQFPPQEDVFNKLASGRCDLQTPESIICMAPELPVDVNYSGEGVCSLLVQSLCNRQPVSAQNLTAAPTKATSRISLGCTWDGCEFSFPSPEDLTNHLIEHSQAVLARWIQPSGCIWQGCRSKAIFKTTLAYEHHLRNIHSHPLVCNAPRCPHKKPFRNHADLDRHNRTAHLKEHRWECPYDSCEAETRTFARKDKWLKHIRETQHQNDAFCPLFHCSLKHRNAMEEFADRKEISNHFASNHSGDPENRYECEFGACSGDHKPDFWSIKGLSSHVRNDHGGNFGSFFLLVILEEEHVFGNQHIRLARERLLCNIEYLHNCEVCGPQNQPANEADAQVNLLSGP